MSEFKLEAKVGFNDEDAWNVQLRVTNIQTKEEARQLGQAFAQQFREFITLRGGRVAEHLVKRDTNLILPDTVQ